MCCVAFLVVEALWLLATFNTRANRAARKSPRDMVAGAVSMVVRYCSKAAAHSYCVAVTSPLKISPKRSQAWPLKRCIWSCEIGAKSVGEVLSFTPGSIVSGT